MITRRALLGSAVAAVAASSTRRAFGAAAAPMPVAFVSHGGPMLAVDPVRGPALRAWGAKLSKPTGVLAITPHWGSRHIALGATGRGVAQYDFPRWLADKLPAGLAYASPPSEALARRVEALLGDAYPVQRGGRTGMDHTTWTPLMHLLPSADVPVLEMAYPYLQEPQLFALGQKLAPLRDEGILLLASGGMTHNLASVDLDRADSPPPAWSREFDAWAAERLAASDADALIDWRHQAPAADLAHPDDGGHFRVMLVGLGAALARGGAAPARFPYVGYELGLSVRCAELG
ncbi:MAG TPA: class III extradiol ring-cleavage dioxygenase [Polyangiaceae bacterium]